MAITSRPMNDFNGYKDNKGLLHVEKGIFSENGVQFRAEELLAKHYNVGLDKEDLDEIHALLNHVIKEGWFDPNPSHDNGPDSHFSHDQMNGLYTLVALLEYYKSYKPYTGYLSELPTVKWNCVKKKKQGRTYYKLQKLLFGSYLWLHPTEIIYYSILKDKKWAIRLLLLLAFAFYTTCSKIRGDTSGKMLVWMMLHTLMLNHNEKVKKQAKEIWTECEKRLEKEHGENPIVDISNYYFTKGEVIENSQHPVIVQILGKYAD